MSEHVSGLPLHNALPAARSLASGGSSMGDYGAHMSSLMIDRVGAAGKSRSGIGAAVLVVSQRLDPAAK